jgi:tRNA A58 N-methylase Trm61
MEKSGFVQIRTIETTQREWASLKGYTHPRYGSTGFTGFMTFGRTDLPYPYMKAAI